MWDAPDLMTLHSWVEENLSEYCASECFQIVEEHSYGIQMELAKARVSENVGSKASAAAASVQERAREAMSHTAAKAKEARAASQKQFSKMDEKFKMTERAQVADGKAKKGECMTGGRSRATGPPGFRGADWRSRALAAVFGKVGQSAKRASETAMKNEAVAKGVKTMGAGLSKGFASLTKAFSQLGDTVKDATNEYQTPADGAAPSATPSAAPAEAPSAAPSAAPAEAPAPAPAEEEAFEGFDAEPAAPELAEEKKPATAPAAPDEAAAASG